MKHAKKLTLSLIALLLAGVLCFALVGCGSNQGYTKLYDYIKQNDISTTDGIIQASVDYDTTDSFVIFTASAEQGDPVRVLVSNYASSNLDGEMSLQFDTDGFSASDPIVIETIFHTSSRYYKGTADFTSFDQSSFTFRNIGSSTSENGTYTPVTSSMEDSVTDALIAATKFFCTVLEAVLSGEINITPESFYN